MTSITAEPLAPGTLLKGRYEVVRLIKGGGMSWIYQVNERRKDATTQLWALKELRIDSDDNHTVAEAEELFEQEAHILVHLSHPNLPRVAAYFAQSQRSYLVMEYVHGETLQERLTAARAPLLESQVVAWAVQICGVLSYLHNQSPPVIFRDMKPSNVMVTPGGDIKLIDFGIARTYKAGKQRDTISMGSENYAAPEQWGQEQTDARSDVYAVGATMYHLLANEPPLPAFVPGERVPLRQRNPSASERVDAIISKAMARDRNDRYQTAEEMRQALLRLLSPWERLRLVGAPGSAGGRNAASAMPARSGQAPDERAGAGRTEREQPAQHMPVYCAVCGAGNRQGAQFCSRCGHPMATAPMARLSVVRPAEHAGRRIDLPAASLIVGRRSPDRITDIDLGALDPNGYVSRQHARMERSAGIWTVVDLDSSNGTSVNGSRVPPGLPVRLRDGDVVRMGQVELRFEEEH
ncbi:MAG: protein kinase [Chloroflexi bacterium]|nr:protein kinase [Chloroflexota bacterium]